MSSAQIQNLPHLQTNFQEIANSSNQKAILYRVAQIVSLVAVVVILGAISAVVLGVLPVIPIWIALPALVAPFGGFWLANKCQAMVDSYKEIRDLNQGMADELKTLKPSDIDPFFTENGIAKQDIHRQVGDAALLHLIASYKYWENQVIGLLREASPNQEPMTTRDDLSIPSQSKKSDFKKPFSLDDLETHPNLTNRKEPLITFLPEPPEIVAIKARRQAFCKEKAAQALVQETIALQNIIDPIKHVKIGADSLVETTFEQRQAQIVQEKPLTLFVKPFYVKGFWGKTCVAEIPRLTLDELIPQLNVYQRPSCIRNLLIERLVLPQ